MSALPYYNEASFTPQWFGSPADVPPGFHSIPNFTLTDQRGKRITEATFKDKIYVANFFFTACPGICPMTMGNMARLQSAFAEDDDILLLSHSVTPHQDSTAALQAFAQKMRSLEGKWHLVTGERAEIYTLGKEAYFAEEDLGEKGMQGKRNEAFLHTESFLLIGQNRRIRGVYNGMNTASVSQLIADIQMLKDEQKG
ncbi:MAG: SCO family protein [Bacteroidota bacterium]